MSPETRTYTAPELDDAFEQELQQMALEVSAPPLEEPREPALSRYLKFQIKDFVKLRMVPMMVSAVLGIWIFHHYYDQFIVERALRRGRDLDADAERLLFSSIVTVGSPLDNSGHR